MNPDAARRPHSVTIAVTLLILGSLTAAVAAMADPQSQAQNLMTLLFVVCSWFAVRAGRGRRVARTTVTCLTAVTLLFATPFALADPLYGGITLLLAALLAVPGVALLYGPTAEAYVRARTAMTHPDRSTTGG